jgi:hypothetical protein
VVLGLGPNAAAEVSTGLKWILGFRGTTTWLGDWVAVGIDDRSQAALAAAIVVDQMPAPGRTDDEELESFLKLPLYVTVGIRDRKEATAYLAALRKFAEHAAPGRFEWTTAPRAM